MQTLMFVKGHELTVSVIIPHIVQTTDDFVFDGATPKVFEWNDLNEVRFRAIVVRQGTANLRINENKKRHV